MYVVVLGPVAVCVDGAWVALGCGVLGAADGVEASAGNCSRPDEWGSLALDVGAWSSEWVVDEGCMVASAVAVGMATGGASASDMAKDLVVDVAVWSCVTGSWMASSIGDW